MRMDEEPSDSLIQEEILDNRIEKLGHRITLVAVLIPILLVIVLVLAYLDLTKRVIRFQDTGTTEVETLEKSLDDRFSSLSVEQAKLKETSDVIVSTVQTNSDNHTKSMEEMDLRIQKTLDHLQKTKSDKAALKEGLKDSVIKIDRFVKPIRKDIKAISSKLKVLEEKLTGEMTHFNGSLGDFNELLVDMNKRLVQSTKNLADLETVISTLSTQKIDNEALHLALNEEKEIYRQMLSLVTRNLEGKLEEFSQKVQELEKQKRNQAETPNTRTPSDAPLPSPSVAPPSTQAPRPGPGEIIEQNLQ